MAVNTQPNVFIPKNRFTIVGGDMSQNDFLRRVGQLEEQLHSTRKQILLEETALLSLEKKLFLASQNLDRVLRQSHRFLVLKQEQTESETAVFRKKTGAKIKSLSSQSKAQQIENAMWEQKVLQRELESLQRGFSKALKKAGKK